MTVARRPPTPPAGNAPKGGAYPRLDPESREASVPIIRALPKGAITEAPSGPLPLAEYLAAVEQFICGFGALPATRLYLLPFQAFLEEVRGQPLVQSLRTTRILHDRVVSVGQSAMLQIWRTLGLIPIERADRTLELRVVAPLR